MALKCDQCGAPLAPARGERRTTCTYCGCVHELETPHPSTREGETSGDGEQEGSVGGTILGLVVFLVAVGATVSIVFLLGDCVDRKPVLGHPVRTALEMAQLGNPPGSGRAFRGKATRGDDRAGRSRRPPRRRAGERFGWTAHGTCVVDADGDGVADVASTTWGYKAGHRLTIVSGADGRILWRGKAVRRNSSFYCLSRRWIAVALPGFQLRLHDTRRPREAVTVRLRDKLNRFAMGPDCVSLETADESVVGFALPSGEKTRCRPRGRRARAQGYSGLIRRHQRRGAVTQGHTAYEVSIRRRGTPMLTVEMRARGRRLWSRELSYAATAAGTALALHPSTLVVYGATTEHDPTGVLLGLDPATGKQRYVKRLERGGNSPSFFHHNGRHLLITFGGGLYAHDPASGELRWKVSW